MQPTAALLVSGKGLVESTRVPNLCALYIFKHHIKVIYVKYKKITLDQIRVKLPVKS